jgi:hypothetical protein
MTTLPNYQTRDDLAFTPAERASAGEKPATLANPEVVVARAEGIHAQTIQQSRLLSALCFLVAAGLAVWEISTGFMVVFLGLAVLVSATARLFALREFRLEIERTARAQGLPEDAARRVAGEKAAAFEG